MDSKVCACWCWGLGEEGRGEGKLFSAPKSK